MADYDSDSSASEFDPSSDIQTNVTLGYASQEFTDDPFSQLGGHPSFFDYILHQSPELLPSASLARCKICNTNMSLLLQLQGDMKSRFPGHERRLYLWTCRRKPCRRKDGSVRGFRGVRAIPSAERGAAEKSRSQVARKGEIGAQPVEENRRNIGSELFSGKSSISSAGSSNPFSSPSSTTGGNPSSASTPTSTNGNPFSSNPGATNTLAAKSPQPPSSTSMPPNQNGTDTDLPATFASKARISSPTSSSVPSTQSPPRKPWPSPADFPQPFPTYHLDADTEYLSPTSSTAPSQINRAGPSNSHKAFLDSGMDVDDSPSSSTKTLGKDAEAEADMYTDRTFQHFAERVAQNDEQVLRYEFDGTPLLFSSTDAVGRLLSPHGHAQAGSNKVRTLAPGDATGRSSGKNVPRCPHCNGRRAFEFQLMPRAIVELESEMDAGAVMSEGMEWGTILFYSCENDCSAGDAVEIDAEGADGKAKVGYSEEWVGVQWEEVVKRK